MATWTDELKEQVIQMYKDAEPTPETSTEIIKEIADELEQSPNGVRQVLVQAKVYIKKEVVAEKGKTSTSKSGSSEGTKRVSKESQIDALRAAINAIGATVDEEILSKLTGKAATYFTSVLSTK
jgi:transposase-like protein